MQSSELDRVEVCRWILDNLGTRLQRPSCLANCRDTRQWRGLFRLPGETMGLDEPVASIRLKQLRRGSQDYEYFWLLAKQANGGQELADSTVSSIIHNFKEEEGAMGSPGMWNHNPEEWERARIKIGDRLSAR